MFPVPPTHFRTAAAFTRQGRGGFAEVPQGRGFAELWPRCGLGSLSSRVLALTRANPAFIRAPAAGAAWTHKLLGPVHLVEVLGEP